MNKVLEKIKNEFNENFGKVLLLTFLNYFLFGVNRIFLGKYMWTPLWSKSSRLVINFIAFYIFIFGIVFLISIFGEKIKKVLVRAFILLSYLIFIVELFLMYVFRTVINNTTVQTALETNKNESREFIQQYLDIKFFVILFIIIIAGYFISKIKVKVNSKILCVILLLGVVVQLVRVKHNIAQMPIQRLVKGVQNGISNKKIYEDLIKKMNTNVVLTKNNSHNDNIVLIIGESTKRSHMGLYDYTLDTNPLLKNISKNNLFVYTDVISPHAQTIPSLKKILTFYDMQSEKEWYTYTNIIDIMKKSGFKTYWFSNQESKGIFANVTVAFSNRTNFVFFNDNISNGDESNNKFDEEIVTESTKTIDFKKKNFVIYHLLGTHSSYKDRYPQSFNKFNSSFYTDIDNQKQKRIISYYDNAVLYNDFVVNSIIDLYKNTSSVVIYLSDHAEELYERRDFYGHGEDNLSKYTVEIPFLIYVSDKFIENYPDKVEKIKESVSRPYMTDDVIHTILDISDIETTEYDPTRSVINDKYISRDRMLHGKSYDNYWKTLN